MSARAQSGVPLLLESPIVGESSRKDSVVLHRDVGRGFRAYYVVVVAPSVYAVRGNRVLVCSETFRGFRVSRPRLSEAYGCV